MSFLAGIKKFDWWLLGSVIVLFVFGLAGIWSTCVARNNFSNFEKQIGFFVVGVLLMWLISMLDYRILRNNSGLILTLYFACVAFLAGLIFFAPVIKGIKGWYKVGFLSIDPIEAAKIVLIILLAKYFSQRHVEMYKFGHIVFSGLYIALPAFFVFIQPDLGGTLVFLAIWLGMLFVSGIKLNHFLILALIFIVVSVFAWNFLLHDYQKQRVTAFLFPYDYLGASWTQNQTKIAIGSGQFFGTGLTNGSQVQYGFLPEPHTDFIFSVLAEDFGMAGIILLFITYGVFIWRVIVIAVQSPSNFPRLFASGFAICIIIQFFINVGMNLSMLPVVGIDLPFVSYGGSALICNFIALGILQSIVIRTRQE
jgi:rod shape determining protein RodA